jgi:hypothetical protein
MEVSQALDVAKGISDYGYLAISAGFFLILTALLWVACFKWFKSTITGVIDRDNSMVSELLKETKAQNEMLSDIVEGLRPETQIKIQTITKTFFELSQEKVLQFITRVRTENHIANREATQAKIRNLITNLHTSRNIKLDCFRFRGRKLPQFTSDEWIDWVCEVVEKEVYDKPNPARERTNVKTVYERIENDLNQHING